MITLIFSLFRLCNILVVELEGFWRFFIPEFGGLMFCFSCIGEGTDHCFDLDLFDIWLD